MVLFPFLYYFAVFFDAGCAGLADNASNLPFRLVSPSSGVADLEACSISGNLLKEMKTQKGSIKELLVNLTPTLTNKYGPPCPCGGSRGWRRIAHLNMSEPSQECPSNWTLHTSPVRGCGRSTFSSYSQDSAFFMADGRTYSRVCGQILAYQKGYPEAFYNSIVLRRNEVDDAYVDGISLTHGPIGSRQHVWTFAVSAYEESSSYESDFNCMCTNTNFTWPYQLPHFIGDNYFCDTGDTGSHSSSIYLDDPLWDGQGCGPNNVCCEFNRPPWFCTLLPRSTSDDLEIRISNGDGQGEDVIVFFIDIFVK